MTMTLPLAGYKRPVLPCEHEPECPAFDAVDHDAAHAVSYHPEQGWTLLCNGVVVFADTGELSPTGLSTAPHRPNPPHAGGSL